MSSEHRLITAFPTLGFATLMRKRVRGREFASGKENVFFLSSGRAAVFHAVRHFGIREPNKILVPSYHCGVEIEAILRAGAGIEYYAVGRDMRVIVQDMLQRIRPEVKALFLVHYWGFPQDTPAIAEICNRHNLLLIEDCAHALFSGNGYGPLGTFGDASVYSLPKTLSVPDGGVLQIRRETPGLDHVARGNSAVAFKGGASLLLENLRSSRNSFLPRIAELVRAAKRPSNRDGGESRPDYGETPLAMYNRGMSRLSRCIFQRSPDHLIRSRRRENYLCLLELLEGIERIGIPFNQLPDGVCPLFCPVTLEDRDGLEQFLQSHRAATFVFGRRLHPTLGRGKYQDAQLLSRQVLGLPIHQDLDRLDMKVIADRVRRWVGS